VSAQGVDERMINYIIIIINYPWGMIKVYWLDDLTLAYILVHAVCCTSATRSGWSLHLIISQLRMKYSLSNCPNHVQQIISSIKIHKKQRKVQWILPTMFREVNVHPIKNWLYTLYFHFLFYCTVYFCVVWCMNVVLITHNLFIFKLNLIQKKLIT